MRRRGGDDEDACSRSSGRSRRGSANSGTCTGHGKTGSTKGLSAHHARLAVGSAATLATFLAETPEGAWSRTRGQGVDYVWSRQQASSGLRERLDIRDVAA